MPLDLAIALKYRGFAGLELSRAKLTAGGRRDKARLTHFPGRR